MYALGLVCELMRTHTGHFSGPSAGQAEKHSQAPLCGCRATPPSLGSDPRPHCTHTTAGRTSLNIPCCFCDGSLLLKALCWLPICPQNMGKYLSLAQKFLQDLAILPAHVSPLSFYTCLVHVLFPFLHLHSFVTKIAISLGSRLNWAI